VVADHNTAIAIDLSGPFGIVRDTRVTNTGGSAIFGEEAGIVLAGTADRALNNDVNNTSNSGGTGTGWAIVFAKAAQFLGVNNRITGANVGINFVVGATGKYRDNLTSGVTTPFAGTGTSAGNNN
jgi:hypothetical protein